MLYVGARNLSSRRIATKRKFFALAKTYPELTDDLSWIVLGLVMYSSASWFGTFGLFASIGDNAVEYGFRSPSENEKSELLKLTTDLGEPGLLGAWFPVLLVLICLSADNLPFSILPEERFVSEDSIDPRLSLRLVDLPLSFFLGVKSLGFSKDISSGCLMPKSVQISFTAWKTPIEKFTLMSTTCRSGI